MNYIEHLLILISTVTRCISFTAFASLVGIPTIQASAIEIKIRVMTGGMKKDKSLTMLSYCLKCRNNPKVVRTRNRRTMFFVKMFRV